MSFRVIDPFCPQAILPMKVTLFSSEMLSVTNIPSINCNDTSFCLELNGGNAGQSFMSLQIILFEIFWCKVEKLSISEKLAFGHSYLGHIWDIIGSMALNDIGSCEEALLICLYLKIATYSVLTPQETSLPPKKRQISLYRYDVWGQPRPLTSDELWKIKMQ